MKVTQMFCRGCDAWQPMSHFIKELVPEAKKKDVLALRCSKTKLLVATAKRIRRIRKK